MLSPHIKKLLYNLIITLQMDNQIDRFGITEPVSKHYVENVLPYEVIV